MPCDEKLSEYAESFGMIEIAILIFQLGVCQNGDHILLRITSALFDQPNQEFLQINGSLSALDHLIACQRG